MTGQHLLLLLWTLWIVFALLSIGDLLGVILALVFGLLGAGLVLTGLATWRGYVIAGLIVHVLVAGYTLAVFRGWLRPTSGRLGLRTLWNWPQSPALQTIFGSVTLVGLASVLYLRPTVSWKYRVDIPLMILAVIAVVASEYALLPVSWRGRHAVTSEDQDSETPDQSDDQVTQEQPGQAAPEHSPTGSGSGAGVAATNGDAIKGKVVSPEESADAEAENHDLINGPEFSLPDVETFLRQHVRDALARSALESEPSVWFHALDEPTTGVFSVELLRTARLTMRQEGSNGIASRVEGITIERWTGPISLEPGEKVSQAITRVAAETHINETEGGAATPVTAQPVSPPGWEVVSARWAHAGLADGNAAARSAADLGAGLDSILHNEPVRPVFSWNAPGSAAAVIGKVAENKETLQIGGIVVGTRSGQPVALSACFWSLARDDLARSLAAGITRELGKIGLSRTPRPSSMQRQPARTPVG